VILMQDVPGAGSLLVLEQHSNQPIRFDMFTVNVKFRLTTRG